RHYLSSGVEQFGADVRAGRDIDVTAGRDLAVIASQLDAKRDLALSVGRDATIAAAANEEHFYSKGDDTTRQEDHVRQQGARLQAGGNLFIDAERDLTFIASEADVGGEAYLVAGDTLSLLSAQDQ